MIAVMTARGDLLVEADAGARQHAGAHRIETGQRHEGQQQRDGQHHQRDLAGARDHAVIDLQHVERPGEIEQVDRQAEDRRGDEITPRGLQQNAEFVSSLAWSNTQTIGGKPPPSKINRFAAQIRQNSWQLSRVSIARTD